MKRRNILQQQRSGRWRIKALVVVLLLTSCFLLILNHYHFSRIFTFGAPEAPPLVVVQKPKIAFLFIARNRLPLDFVWDAFFQGEKEGKFSIFVHSRPGFLLNEVTTRSAYFSGRQVNNSIQVEWGEASMIEAERILLRNALKDSSNHRFLFLSDSCIPLYNFSYTYHYIMSTSTSFIDSFADTKQGRYNPKMNPVIPVSDWRKGSQWVVLTRKHAEVMVNDDTVFPEFERHCRRRSLPEFWRDHPLPTDGSKEHNCIPDEHYVQTLIAHKGLEGEITRRTLTHTLWDLSSSKDRERRGWHPVTYKLSDATPTLIQTIKGIDNVYYETEYRREWCRSNGRPSTCFLFARKFTRAAVMRLLNTSAIVLN
ncbi:Core-2/I-Branching enzyme [Musa troglodytarum]|uniref:Core-2/I-Branching enzyme n=1 Tax=Musa troglodytarum TaxID=320322 RepID=A0A9E7JQ50_9LILI|nr:Core-2/I-Branching enzyme [Musa troglodytarum]